MLSEVYRTSYEWAKLGSSSIRYPFGVMIYSVEHPAYNENNCVWYFDPRAATSHTHDAVVQEFLKRGLHCSCWVPSPEADLDACEAYLTAIGLVDSPATALILELDQKRPLPVNSSLFVRRSDEESLKSVYSLNGQRWAGATRDKAISLLACLNYESYVSVQDGELVGRAGLLKLDGNVARLKSIFVGGPFRRRGIASGLIAYIANRAAELGYRQLASEVEVSNQPSLQCHLNLGFEPVGTIHAYGEPCS